MGGGAPGNCFVLGVDLALQGSVFKTFKRPIFSLSTLHYALTFQHRFFVPSKTARNSRPRCEIDLVQFQISLNYNTQYLLNVFEDLKKADFTARTVKKLAKSVGISFFKPCWERKCLGTLIYSKIAF